MNKIKDIRKVISSNGRTMCITLPADWVKENDVQKHDPIKATKKGSKLIIEKIYI